MSAAATLAASLPVAESLTLTFVLPPEDGASSGANHFSTMSDGPPQFLGSSRNSPEREPTARTLFSRESLICERTNSVASLLVIVPLLSVHWMR